MIASILKIMTNPFSLLPVTLLAIYVGINAPTLGFALAPVGKYYISLMKMIVLPYLFVTITLGIARVASNPKAAEYTRRILITYPLTLVFVAVFGLGIALILPPAGSDDAASMASMGNLVSTQGADQDSVNLTNPTADIKIEEPILFDRFVPTNIFEALNNGDTLKVVIFCIILGAALARKVDKNTENLFGMFKVVQESCAQVIYWITLGLPFALFSMISAQVASVGVEPLVSLAPFMLTQITGAVCLMAISVLVISYRAGVSPIQAAKRLSDTLVLALTTQSGPACIPTAIREMTTKLGFSTAGADLLIPLGTTVCRVASTQYFAIGAIFAAQIYGVELDFAQYATIIVFSIAAGIASSGATGAVAVVQMSIVTDALRLPSEAIIPMFIAVDPIVTVFRVFVLVLGTCATTAIIIPKLRRHKEENDHSLAMSANE
jgi:proton glutamate symport protein